MWQNPFPSPDPFPGLAIAGYWFTAPIPLALAPYAFGGWSGVYAVADLTPWGPIWLDVGESDDVGRRLRWHDRRPDWRAATTGWPMVAYTYPARGSFDRWLAERLVRGVLNPACGDR